MTEIKPATDEQIEALAIKHHVWGSRTADCGIGELAALVAEAEAPLLARIAELEQYMRKDAAHWFINFPVLINGLLCERPTEIIPVPGRSYTFELPPQPPRRPEDQGAG